MNPSKWLALAATPTFGLIGFSNWIHSQLIGSGNSEMVMAPIGGMTVMYMLMALFHAPAWLQWFCARLERSV